MLGLLLVSGLIAALFGVVLLHAVSEERKRKAPDFTPVERWGADGGISRRIEMSRSVRKVADSADGGTIPSRVNLVRRVA